MHLFGGVGVDLREMGGALHFHGIWAVVEFKCLSCKSSYPCVKSVQSVFPRVDAGDDSIVDIDKSILGVLDSYQSSVKKFLLMHLVPVDADVGLLHSPRLLSDLSLDVCLRSSLVLLCFVYIHHIYKIKVKDIFNSY